MNIQSVVAAQTPRDATAANRAIQSDDGGVAASFAGLLASVLFGQPAAQQPATMSQADGTSELDQQDSGAADADATGSVGESKNAKDGREASDAADPANPALPTIATTSAANEIVRSVGALDPSLQAKLARVVQRVEQETRHTVTVQETYRSQTRQNALYAQGRDTAGPVVTWTHNSKHTEGRAVDVVLDGGNASADAYRVLQRIAQEEGLHTLGPRDPGHLELPTNGSSPNASALSALNVPSAPADATSPGRVPTSQAASNAQVAVPSVARVAKVAQVAQVAQVAPVGRPGVAASSGVSVNHQSLGSQTNGRGSNDSTNDRGGQTPNDARNGYAALGATFSTRAHDGPPLDVSSIAAPASNAAEHVERVMSAVDNAPARHLSQITMSVDAGNGTTDRVQVAMRGSSLSSTIDAADNRGAQAMNARSEELVRALNRDGIDVESLRVRSAAERPANTVTATTSTQNANTAADAQSHSRFDRGDAWQQRQDQQERRETLEERRQQRQQNQPRGGSAR